MDSHPLKTLQSKTALDPVVFTQPLAAPPLLILKKVLVRRGQKTRTDWYFMSAKVTRKLKVTSNII